MKRFLSLILVLALLIGVVPAAAAEAPTDVMEVFNCNEYVTLRREADTKSKELTKVLKGSLVYFQGYADNGFYFVHFDGKDGYILSKYLKNTYFEIGDLICTNQQVYNCSEWVSLRKDMDTKSERLAKVPLGAIVTRVVNADEGWMLCTYNGKTGYIKKDYLRKADYDKIKQEEAEKKRKAEEEAAQNYPKTAIDCMQVVNVNSWVSLRQSPSTDSKRLMEVPVYAYVTDCLYVSAGWVHVYYEGQNGYISSKYLTPAEMPYEPDEPEDGSMGFDLLPALPSYDAFMSAGDLVCEADLGTYYVAARRAYSSVSGLKEELLAVCYDAMKRPLWTAFEMETDIGELDATSAFIAGTKDFPCLVTFQCDKGFTARAIDGKGTLLWNYDGKIGNGDNPMLPGGGLSSTVDENGTMYVIGYHNVDPIAIDVNGNFLWKGVSPVDDDLYWPCEMTVTAAGLMVRYDGGIEGMDYLVFYSAETGACTGCTMADEPAYDYEGGEIYG